MEGGLVVGVLAVHLVDHNNAGDTALLGEAPRLLGADLHARRGVEQQHGGIHHAHRGLHLAYELGVARRVDRVDLGVLPLHRRDRKLDRMVRPRLVGVVV